MTEREKPSERPRGISRRDFARRAALAAATAAVLPGDFLTRAEATAAPQAAQQPEEAKLSPESRAEVEAKIQEIFRKYGSRIPEDQKADVRRLVREGQKSLESLRAFPLDNADQPATVFELYPEAAAARRGPPAPRVTLKKG